MHIGARFRMASFVMVLSGAMAWSAAPGRSDDPPPLTQNHVLGLTETAMAPGQVTKAEPPRAISPLSKEDRAALKDTNRVYKGKDWKALSPQERDGVIRGLREANADGTIFVIDVRTGDIYKFDPLPPPTDADRNKSDDVRLSERNGIGIRFFTMDDLLKLAVAAADRPFSQSDRSGDALVVGRVKLDL